VTWFTLAGLVIALTAAVAAGALLHAAAERPGAFARTGGAATSSTSTPTRPIRTPAMRAARQRHPANRVTWTCHACHEALAGPVVEHICGDA
jgi:hypothetical protein